jgi:Concanavalin A-like lectin/glucanases superfamily
VLKDESWYNIIMALVNITLPSDGTSADVADYNTPLTTIVGAINGGLDSTNISSLSGAKITSGTMPISSLDAAGRTAWITDPTTLPVPNTVIYNGNNSYDLVFNGINLTSTVSEGMRLRTTRSVAAPTQSTSLNGTTQYWTKTSPNKMTWIDDFTVVANGVYLTSYPATSAQVISRYNGTSGWQLRIESTGQVALYGLNGGAGNYSGVISVQSVPLNKEFSIVAQLDMSTFTATTTTSYIMIDGKDIPCTVVRGGTNPTALIQAGDLQVGAANSTQFFPGYISQTGVFNAKVTQATAMTYWSQGLSGSEINLASAYSFNGVATDLNTTTPNDLTAVASAGYITASPFGNNGISTTLDYALIMKVAFSTNTTITIQVPAGCKIPTSGGISSLSYSTASRPYGWPNKKNDWRQQVSFPGNSTNTPTGGVFYRPVTGAAFTLPSGSFYVTATIAHRGHSSAGSYVTSEVAVSTSTSSVSDIDLYGIMGTDNGTAPNPITITGSCTMQKYVTTPSPLTYYPIQKVTVQTTLGNTNGFYQCFIAADPEGL